LVPSGNFFLGSTSARMDRLYGLIQDLKALAPVDRFVKSWEEEHPSVRYLLMQSAPLLVPVQVDSFMNIAVLTPAG
jgi:hypothetical protein